MRKEGIEQGQSDEVEQIQMKIVKVSRFGSNPDVVLHGENNKQITATLQSIKGFVDKRDFRPAELKNFIEGRNNSITPIQPFIAYPVINKNSGLCYQITFERLIPTTPEFIDAQAYGKPYAMPTVIRFGLGTYKIRTKNDLPISLQLGNFSANSSIKFKGIKIDRTFSHSARSIHNLIKILRDIIELDAQNDFKTPDELMAVLKKRI